MIAITLIAMGEDIGAEMSLRQFNHLVSDYHSFCDCVNLGDFLIKDVLWRAHNSESCQRFKSHT